jgi:hypothetical protein
MAEFNQEDLFDTEQRPGAGTRLWSKAVAMQYDRVVDANYRHRRSNEPEAAEADKDETAESQLHVDVYFLALAIRRVLRFHDAIAKQIDDPRLAAAREQFQKTAWPAKDFRDFWEHLDEYLVGTGRRQASGEVSGRISPVLYLRWDADNVAVRFGDTTMDITVAAQAASELAGVTGDVWEECLEQTRGSSQEEPPTDDGIDRWLQVRKSISTVIGGPDEGLQVSTGVLRDVRVTEDPDAPWD